MSELPDVRNSSSPKIDEVLNNDLKLKEIDVQISKINSDISKLMNKSKQTPAEARKLNVLLLDSEELTETRKQRALQLNALLKKNKII